MIDTHAHLDGEEFADDLSAVVERARAAGVQQVFLPNINAASMPRIRQLCSGYPDFFRPMIGLHPEDVNPQTTDIAATLAAMEDELRRNVGTPSAYIAVGEVGLDFYWDDTYRDEQLKAFETQVEWAIRYNLPLMIHTRSAHAELVDVMERNRHHHLRGVFHCFTGTAEEAERLLTFDNFVLGIGGVLTFKKSTLPDVLHDGVPLSRIVLETDAPYMAPVPHRGQRNESAYVAAVAQKLADIYGQTLQQVDEQTTANVRRIFRQA